MVLKYYEGANFGDAVNPLIFEKLLPGFFDNDERTLFFGIGSILGFIRGEKNTEKIIVFSSGYAYDHVPVVDGSWDIRCVRGPLTASAMKVDHSLAVIDGAVLIRSVPEFNVPVDKKFRFSYIPHHKSEEMFDRWEEVLEDTGINYISPRQHPALVIEQIRQSETVLAEAMHGAIFADSLRVPWIPVRMFEHINEFKWRDWLLSVGMEYEPARIFRIYNMAWINWIMNDKFRFREGSVVNRISSAAYRGWQRAVLEDRFKREIERIALRTEPQLSNEGVLSSKEARLLEILDGLKRDYGV